MKRFGEYIDTYKLMDAVHDGATLQILYEGRTADTALRTSTASTPSSRTLPGAQRGGAAAIKKKYGATGDILEAEKRIAAIARDLVDHYIDNILPDGFKAQVVRPPSWRRSATRRPSERRCRADDREKRTA